MIVDGGALQVAQVPWDREARFKLPVEIWRAAIDAHYPQSIWLRLSKETFDRLYRFKVTHGIPLWDKVLENLLDHAEHADAREAIGVIAGGGQ